MPRSLPTLGRQVGFAATAFAFALAMMGTTLPTPLYVLYRQHFGFSELMITVIFATYAAGVVAALLLFGRLSDAIGRRPVLLAALALSAVSALVFLVADGLALLIAGRIISGLSAGVFTGTATATLVDLAAPERRARATLVATVANMAGLGYGPLLAGVLSEWAGWPLRLTFWVDLALLAPAALGILTMPEPVVTRSGLQLRPRLWRVPAEMRATFAEASVAAFAGAAVLGLFTAVSPAFLGQTLGVTNRAAVGLVVFVVFAASTLGQASLQFVRERLALPAGCMVLVAGMGFLALALWRSSLTLLILGGVVAGFEQSLSFRAGLAELNERSPAERRAEVASSFFVVMYLALALPVIGEGVLTRVVGLRTAGLSFAAVVAALAAVALLLLWRGSQHEERVRLPVAHGHKPSAA